MRFLGTKEDGIISAYYTIKYMSKDPVKVKHMLPVFYVARKNSRQSKALDKGPERDAMTFINRSMNNYTGCCFVRGPRVVSKWHSLTPERILFLMCNTFETCAINPPPVQIG